jgi:hypothetical protein
LSLFDRFTRDEISQWIWWPATMLLVVLFFLTFPGQNRAADAERERATMRAAAYARDVIAPLTGDETISAPFDPEVAGQLDRSIGSLVLADPNVEVVRVWASDSTMMLWSSRRRDAVGSAAGLNDPEITTAAADPTAARSFVLDKDLGGLEGPPTFSAYAPFPVGGAIALAQFEVPEATLLADVRTTWLGYRITAGVAVLLLFGLALGSLRDPVARIGAGVPFSPASVPRDMDVIELDRRIELERAGQHVRERVATMEARLQESEEARRKLEGDLQRTMTELATRSPSVRSAIPRAEGPRPAPVPLTVVAEPAAAAESKAEPAVKAEPEPVVEVEREPTPVVEVEREPAPVVKAEPAIKAEAEPAVKPAASATRKAGSAPKPRRAKAEPTGDGAPRTRRPAARTQVDDESTVAASIPEPQVEQVAATSPSVAAPEIESRPEPRRVPEPTEPYPPERTESHPPEPTEPVWPPRARPRHPRLEESVLLPESEVVSTTSEPDEDAVGVLERLIEPVGSPIHPGEDPSVLREKLARTAALKKPGSRNEQGLREHDAEPPVGA